MQLRASAASMLCGLALCVAGPALADSSDPAQQLSQLLEPLHTYSGDFQQQIEDNNGQAQQKSSGHMWLARPGKFRWVVNEPYSQTVVSDGKKVYLYDPDLQQVTIRTLDPKVTSTPALLLSGSADQLTNDYSVSERDAGSSQIFTLTPHDRGSLFRSLDLTFNGKNLTSLNMTDASGQRTAISFSRVQQNISVDTSQFVFHIPKGADVVNEQ